jgi:hypothetical protein
MATINHLLKRCAISLCALAVLVLSACGPGTGGTGTGPNVASSPAPFTSSYFTSEGADTATAPLPNPPTTPTTTTSLPGITCTAACTGNLDNQRLSLHLQADRIELTTPCATFTYTGGWTVSANGETTVQGVWKNSAVVSGQTSRSSQNATLTLIFSNGLESSNAASVSIKDSTGKLLLGPVTLQRAASAPASIGASGC